MTYQLRAPRWTTAHGLPVFCCQPCFDAYGQGLECVYCTITWAPPYKPWHGFYR